LRAVRADGLKFIEAPRPELYALRNDPGELKNEYEPWSAAAQKSRKILSERWARMPRPATSSATVAAGTLEELRALGYLGPADAGSATNVPEPSLLPDPKDKIEEQNLLHSAMMAADAGNSTDARASLEKVLELNPKSETALVQLGNLWLRAGDYEKASEYLARARELRPEDPAAALYHGQALAKSGDLAGSKAALEACVKLNPKQPAEARVLLGQVYLQLKDYAAAEDQFEATLLLEPENLDGRLGLARTEILGHRFEEALKDLAPLSKSHSGNAEVFDLLAQAYAGLGRKADAERAKNRATELRKSAPASK
jgi:predicted Zn-dependent protease